MQDDSGTRTLPTLDDVAKVAGVSRATVSRVVNGRQTVTARTREVVMNAVEATGYVPNLAARSLMTRRTGAVVIVISGTDPDARDGAERAGTEASVFEDPFFGRVTGGFLGALRPRDVHPVLMLADTDATRRRIVSYMQQGNADGALLVSTRADDPLPQMVLDAGLSAVLFARPSRPQPMSFVDVAHQDGARRAADHLVSRGCRNVAMITGPLGVVAAHDRLTGFRDAMARHGQAYVPSVQGNFTLESGELSVLELMDLAPGTDGIFAANDLMAAGAVHGLRARGRRVPEDVAVIGFDDSAVAAQSRPTLTTVRQPIEEMAGEMVRILLEQIDDPARRASSVIFQPSLVVRDSA